MSKRILIVGHHNDVFIIRLLEEIHNQKDIDLEIELFDCSVFSDNADFSAIPYKSYAVKVPIILKPLLKIPRVRIPFRKFVVNKTLRKILSKKDFDAINIHELPNYTLGLVRLTHKLGAKTILTPIGSDALRTEGALKRSLKIAFSETDYVTITKNSGFAQKVFQRFDIDRQKVNDLSYGSDAISEICRMDQHFSKVELADMLGIPNSDYYICCGYNAHRAQNHAIMLEAVSSNLKSLPKGYKILVPLGYGDKEVMRHELEELNKKWHLDIVYLMDFLSPTKVAALRLITDLFIHIQDTDAHSFTIREFLLANTQVINGSWLSYPELEKYGVPYHTCDSLESLKEVIRQVLTGQVAAIPCPLQLKKWLKNSSWENISKRWVDFYLSI